MACSFVCTGRVPSALPAREQLESTLFQEVSLWSLQSHLPCSTSPLASQPWGPGTWSCFIVKFTHHFLSTHIRNWDSPHACSLARRLRVHEAQLPGLSPGLTGAEFKPPSYHFLSFSLFSKYVPMGWHIFLLAADSQPPVNLPSQSDGHPKCS